MRLALFSFEVTDKAADKLAKWVAKKPEETSVVYITTAANVYPPNPDWLVHTEKQLKSYGFKVENFDLEKAYKNKVNLRKYFNDKDIIFIGGGNSFYLLHWIYRTGFDKLLKDLINSGKIYAGASAGAVCVVDDMKPIRFIDEAEKSPSKITRGLGFVDFAIIPHWADEKYQKELEKVKKEYSNNGYKVHTITNTEALFVDQGRVVKIG